MKRRGHLGRYERNLDLIHTIFDVAVPRKPRKARESLLYSNDACRRHPSFTFFKHRQIISSTNSINPIMQYCINLPVSNKIIQHITDWKQIHRQHRGWSHHSKPTKQSTGQDKQPPTYSHSTILIHQLVFSSSKVKCTHNSISLSLSLPHQVTEEDSLLPHP